MALARHLARGRLYYGWYIVAVAFLVQMVSSGYHVYAPSVLLKPIVEDLGWSRAMFAGVISLSGLVTGFLYPFVGSLLDRRGARDLMIGGAFVLGLGFVALGRVDAYWQFVVLQGFVIPVGFVGVSTLVSSVAVANWFVRKRGRALALSTAGLAAGNYAITPLTALLVAGLGWRNGVTALGLLAWVLIVPPALLAVRRRPEDMGLSPDGDGPAPAATLAQTQSHEVTWTRRQALHTRTLWLLIAVFTLAALGTGGVLLHLVSYLTDSGLPVQTAAIAMMAIGLTSTSARLFLGFILDRFSLRYVTMGSFFLSALAVALLLLGGGHLPLTVLALMFQGLALGINLPAQEALWASYFGRRSLGAVRSLALPFTQLGSAAGATFSGLVFTAMGSYAPAFGTVIAGFLMAAGLLALSRPPSHPAQAGLAGRDRLTAVNP